MNQIDFYISGECCWSKILNSVHDLSDICTKFPNIISQSSFQHVHINDFLSFASYAIPRIVSDIEFVLAVIQILQEYSNSAQLQNLIISSYISLLHECILLCDRVFRQQSNTLTRLRHVINCIQQLMTNCLNTFSALQEAIRMLLETIVAHSGHSCHIETVRECVVVLNRILEPVVRADRTSLRGEMSYLISPLLDLLHSCGDYDVQASLVECLMRLTSRTDRLSCAREWFPAEIVDHFVRITTFDVDCRTLLNAFNEKLLYRRCVHSYPALTVRLFGVQLHKPSDAGYLNFWVDFNEGSKSITFYFARAETNNSAWEIATLRAYDVIKAKLCISCDTQQLHVTLHSKSDVLIDSRSVVSLAPNSGQLHAFLEFNKSRDLHQVLSRIYEDKYAFVSSMESLDDAAQSTNMSTKVSVPLVNVRTSQRKHSVAHHPISVKHDCTVDSLHDDSEVPPRQGSLYSEIPSIQPADFHGFSCQNCEQTVAESPHTAQTNLSQNSDRQVVVEDTHDGTSCNPIVYTDVAQSHVEVGKTRQDVSECLDRAPSDIVSAQIDTITANAVSPNSQRSERNAIEPIHNANNDIRLSNNSIMSHESHSVGKRTPFAHNNNTNCAEQNTLKVSNNSTNKFCHNNATKSAKIILVKEQLDDLTRQLSSSPPNISEALDDIRNNTGCTNLCDESTNKKRRALFTTSNLPLEIEPRSNSNSVIVVTMKKHPKQKKNVAQRIPPSDTDLVKRVSNRPRRKAVQNVSYMEDNSSISTYEKPLKTTKPTKSTKVNTNGVKNVVEKHSPSINKTIISKTLQRNRKEKSLFSIFSDFNETSSASEKDSLLKFKQLKSLEKPLKVYSYLNEKRHATFMSSFHTSYNTSNSTSAAAIDNTNQKNQSKREKSRKDLKNKKRKRKMETEVLRNCSGSESMIDELRVPKRTIDRREEDWLSSWSSLVVETPKNQSTKHSMNEKAHRLAANKTIAPGDTKTNQTPSDMDIESDQLVEELDEVPQQQPVGNTQHDTTSSTHRHAAQIDDATVPVHPLDNSCLTVSAHNSLVLPEAPTTTPVTDCSRNNRNVAGARGADVTRLLDSASRRLTEEGLASKRADTTDSVRAVCEAEQTECSHGASHALDATRLCDTLESRWTSQTLALDESIAAISQIMCALEQYRSEREADQRYLRELREIAVHRYTTGNK